MVRADANCVHGQSGRELRACSKWRNPAGWLVIDEILVIGVVAHATASGFYEGWNGHNHAEYPRTDVCRYGGSNGEFGEERCASQRCEKARAW